MTDFLLSGFGLDRVYACIAVRPYTRIADFLWRGVDETALDLTLVRAVRLFPLLAAGLRTWTTGYLSTALKMLLVGFAVILVFLTF